MAIRFLDEPVKEDKPTIKFLDTPEDNKPKVRFLDEVKPAFSAATRTLKDILSGVGKATGIVPGPTFSGQPEAVKQTALNVGEAVTTDIPGINKIEPAIENGVSSFSEKFPKVPAAIPAAVGTVASMGAGMLPKNVAEAATFAAAPEIAKPAAKAAESAIEGTILSKPLPFFKNSPKPFSRPIGDLIKEKTPQTSVEAPVEATGTIPKPETTSTLKSDMDYINQNKQHLYRVYDNITSTQQEATIKNGFKTVTEGEVINKNVLKTAFNNIMDDKPLSPLQAKTLRENIESIKTWENTNPKTGKLMTPEEKAKINLFDMQAETPKTALKAKTDQVENRNLLEGFTPEVEQPNLPELITANGIGAYAKPIRLEFRNNALMTKEMLFKEIEKMYPNKIFRIAKYEPNISDGEKGLQKYEVQFFHDDGIRHTDYPSDMLNKLGLSKPLARGFEPEIKPKIVELNAGLPLNKIPEVRDIANNVSKTWQDIQKITRPYRVSDEAQIGAETFRENLGKMARSHDQLQESVKSARTIFDKMPNEKNVDIIDRAEKGLPQETPDLTQIMGTLQDMLKKRATEVQKLGTGKMKEFIDNYFPHIWDQNSGPISMGARRPFEGSGSFLKHRVFQSTKEGLNAGYKPLSYNPVDLTMLKMREMDKYLMAHRTINSLKEQGLTKFVKIGGDVPEGWTKLNDKISTVYSKGANGELILRGSYYAQPEMGRIINNYLSPGLQGNPIYDLYRQSGNVLNQFQLGLSAFHAGFTSLDATISKAALAIRQFSDGKPLQAGLTALETPFAPVTNYLRGNKLLKEWSKTGGTGPEAQLADLMASAGGRAKMDKFYATEMVKQIKSNFKEGKVFSGVFKIPLAIVEKASVPIMEYLVPRQKLGVFADIMKYELEKNPNATAEQMRTLAQKAWDSVDNRMGQMVYDNLFWNRSLKDALLASVRSVGWNLGTIREIGGGVKDSASMLKDLISGKHTEISNRTAYTIALPIVTAIYGATYQYLRTGEGPKDMKDLYFPRNGAKDRNGNPARDSLPSYMKDIYHYGTNPVGTLLNKLGPINSTVFQMLNNKDFYGVEIRSKDDPVIKQMQQELEYLGKQTIPFGIRNAERNTKKDFISQALPFVGVVSAPYDINKTKAEIKAGEIIHGKMSNAPRIKQQFEKSELIKQLRMEFVNRDKNYGSDLSKAVKDGKLSQKDVLSIYKKSNENELVKDVRSFTANEVADVLLEATNEEIKTLYPIYIVKFQNTLQNHSPDEQDKMLSVFKLVQAYKKGKNK